MGSDCGCGLVFRGGSRQKKKARTCKYRPTVKDRRTLKKWKAGKSIGFTARSSLKAKGLILRANGKKFVSEKYC
jgi:hypothetical protein